jgi:large subunit ribosomal protein L31
MKQNMHPTSKEITITCTCGAVINTVSTTCKDFSTELCSKCHPFFTGKQRLIDSTGRVERFQKRYAKFEKKSATKAETKPEVEETKTETENNEKL